MSVPPSTIPKKNGWFLGANGLGNVWQSRLDHRRQKDRVPRTAKTPICTAYNDVVTKSIAMVGRFPIPIYSSNALYAKKPFTRMSLSPSLPLSLSLDVQQSINPPTTSTGTKRKCKAPRELFVFSCHNVEYQENTARYWTKSETVNYAGLSTRLMTTAVHSPGARAKNHVMKRSPMTRSESLANAPLFG